MMMECRRGCQYQGRAEPVVTLVVPVLNEIDAVQDFCTTVFRVLESASFKWNVLFVDDGSTDGTPDELRRLSESYGWVSYILFSRNFGKEAALTAGLAHARSDAVVPMDVDLQDPPELILDFVKIWQERGVDMVYGIRKNRAEDSSTKRHTAGWFYRLFNRISDTRIPQNAGDYRLLDRRVVDVISSLPERERFMKGLYAWAGFSSVGIPFERPARKVGKSKFNYWKLWNFALDGLFSFSTLPLRVWSYIGGAVAMLGFFYILVIVAQVVFQGRDVPGYASLMTVMLFFGGMQLLSIGILGEYVGRLYVEAKQRPLYVISEKGPDFEV